MYAIRSYYVGGLALACAVGCGETPAERAPSATPVAEAVDFAFQSGRFEDDLFYRPLVRYRYAAPGGSFVGDKLASTGRLYPKEAAARRVAARYPVGSSVMARYNPADPADVITSYSIHYTKLYDYFSWIVLDQNSYAISGIIGIFKMFGV